MAILDEIRAALAEVQDPELHRSIVELGMVQDLEFSDGIVSLTVLLTIPGCPMKNTIRNDITAALTKISGVTKVALKFGSMNDEQRANVKKVLGQPAADIPFNLPTSTTQIICVASGKGGVGKSSVTVNLALALASLGKSVGILDADIYGHSVPGILGIDQARPTGGVDGQILPVPALGIKVISMGMFKEKKHDIIAWRGPMLDKALTQLLSEVAWENPDFLLIDLPPGTGDISLSIGQKLPGSSVLVVTTPQTAAAEVAERAGVMSGILKQRVMGVVENMSWLAADCPHCNQPLRLELFGAGGGQDAAKSISKHCGYEVPLLAQIPLDPKLRSGADAGEPIVASDPQNPAAQAILELARGIAKNKKPLAGIPLGLNPAENRIRK